MSSRIGFDLACRRTSAGGSFARTGLPLALSSATYNANNQLTQWGTAALTYDLNGNLTGDGVNNYSWDARNQLASITAASGGATIGTFQYDAFGRRASKAVVGTTTSFLYDGVNAVQELSGSTPTANLLTGGVDQFFSRTDSTGTFTPLTDALGSTIALTDSTGAVQTQYTYEPFGNTTVSGPASTNTFQYTGRENDGTGLYFYRARYHSPIYQRFVSEDPDGFGAGSANLYNYAFNGPPNFTDPSGRQTGEAVWTGAEMGTAVGGFPWGTVIGGVVGLGIEGWAAYELWKTYQSSQSDAPPDAQSQSVPKSPPSTELVSSSDFEYV